MNSTIDKAKCVNNSNNNIRSWLFGNMPHLVASACKRERKDGPAEDLQMMEFH